MGIKRVEEVVVKEVVTCDICGRELSEPSYGILGNEKCLCSWCARQIMIMKGDMINFIVKNKKQLISISKELETIEKNYSGIVVDCGCAEKEEVLKKNVDTFIFKETL